MKYRADRKPYTYKPRDYYVTTDLARIFGVTVGTITAKIRSGIIIAYKVSPRSAYRIPKKEAERIIEVFRRGYGI